LQNLFEDCRTGQLPRKPFMNGATPSFHDPTQAPPGKATAFMWQLMTYNLWGNPSTGTRRATIGSKSNSRLAKVRAQCRRE
jgi:phytoene dehydrogenase-like protein